MAGKENVCQREVFGELFRLHSTNLFNFLYYKYGAENNPRDLVQEAFMKLWNNCEKVTYDKAKSFLFTVANNQMLNELSKKKTALNYQKEKHRFYTVESPEYILQENEYANRLKEALKELTEDQRVTFMLNRIDGKKHKEIAEMLGISRKAVEKRIYKTLTILREKLGDI